MQQLSLLQNIQCEVEVTSYNSTIPPSKCYLSYLGAYKTSCLFLILYSSRPPSQIWGTLQMVWWGTLCSLSFSVLGHPTVRFYLFIYIINFWTLLCLFWFSVLVIVFNLWVCWFFSIRLSLGKTWYWEIILFIIVCAG